MTKGALVVLACGWMGLLAGCSTRTLVGAVDGGAGNAGSIGSGGHGGGVGAAGAGGAETAGAAGTSGAAGIGGTAGAGGTTGYGGAAGMECTTSNGGAAGTQTARTLSFGPARQYTLDRAGVTSIAVGDFSRDGNPDLVVAVEREISTFVNRGDGTFAAPVNYPIRNPSVVAMGDIDDDGGADLAVASIYGGGIDVLINHAGLFAPTVTYDVVTGSDAIALADLDGDGKNDIAAIDTAADSLAVLLNGGTLTFSAMMSPLPPGPTGFAIGDMNRDCRPDIVVSNLGGITSPSGVPSPGGVTVIRNFGGGFGTADPLAGATTNPPSVVLADVNGDGKLDIVAPDAFGRAAVLLNIGSFPFAAFSAAVSYALGATDASASLAVGDMDGDGRPDIAFANGSSLGVILNRGNGAFGLPMTFPATLGVSRVAVEDLNHDGKPDIVATTDQAVVVLLNTSQ